MRDDATIQSVIEHALNAAAAFSNSKARRDRESKEAAWLQGVSCIDDLVTLLDLELVPREEVKTR